MSITPTTWNPADKGANLTLSNSNLTVSQSGTSQSEIVKSVYSASTGKYYWEITITANALPGGNNWAHVGIVQTSDFVLENTIGTIGTDYGYSGRNGEIEHGQSYDAGSAYGNSYVVDDVIGIALDLDNGKIWFAKNGVWQNSGDPETGVNPAFSSISGTYFAAGAAYVSGNSVTANFGASAFSYSVPTGFNSGFGELSTSPSESPSSSPSNSPSVSPSESPSNSPSDSPSDSPSSSPSNSPSASPSASPSESPSESPSASPSESTDVIIDEITITPDLMLDIKAIKFSADLDDWADLAPSAITIASDTVSGAYTSVISGPESPDASTSPNILLGRLRIGATSSYILLEPTSPLRISLYSADTEVARIGNLNGFLGYLTNLYGIAIGDVTTYIKYDIDNGMVISGSITLAGGSSVPWALVTGTPNVTYIDANGIYTGTLTASQINAVAINADSITAGTLNVDRLNALSIGTTKIANDAISTAKIIDDAVTSLVSAYTAASFLLLDTEIEEQIQTASTTITDKPVLINFSCYGAGGITVRLYRDYTLVAQGDSSLAAIDNPGAGTYNYNVTAQPFQSGASASYRTLTILEIKK